MYEVRRSKLFQNTPNPVVGATTICFRLTEAHFAVLTLRDAAGGLLSEQKIEGIAVMDLYDYLISCTLTAGDFSATRKMVVMK